MSDLDPRAPVIVGAGQLTLHEDAPSPLELMERATRLAAEDSGAGDRLLGGLGSVAVVDSLSWPVPDPGTPLAAAIRAYPHETVKSNLGGTGPIELLGDACERILAGELDSSLLVGAESFTELMAAIKEGRDTGWPTQDEGAAPDRLIGLNRHGGHDAESAAALIAPVSYYPLFENAVRAGNGGDRAAHREWLGELWGRFAAVASENRHAWARSFPSAREIASTSPANRMIADPYPKLMTANIQVNQGAALLLCSAQAAATAGVPRERWVFVHATAKAHDHWFAGERDRLDRSPAISCGGGAALHHAGIGIDDVGVLDLYSCFPSAVQIAAAELGIDLRTDSRAPTVTGGLTFAGGPGNNYVTHSLAALAGRLRAEPDAFGLATAVGWFMTKHGVAVLSARPPTSPFAQFDVQSDVDALPGREIAMDARGSEAPIEAHTTLYERDGSPNVGVVSCLLEDGRRAFAKCDDAQSIEELLSADPIGRPVRLRNGPRFEFV